MIDHIFNRLSRLIFVITFFTISISFAGLMYAEGLSQRLGFNISIFDLKFYDFFIFVVIADNLNVLLGFIIFSAISISFVLYPKSVRFIFDLVYICFAFLWSLLGGEKKIIPFLCIFVFPFCLIPFLIILVIHVIIIKLKEIKLLRGYWKEIQKKLNMDEKYLDSINRFSDGSQNFYKSYLVFFIIFSFFVVWLAWIVYIGNQGKEHADKYLISKKYKTVILISKQRVDGVFVSKVKNGYLFVLNENGKNNNKATFISDSAILRID